MIKNTLKDICLFGSLNEKQIDRLSQISSIKKFRPGNILFYEGDEPKNLYFLLDGLVKLYRYDINDNKNILSYYYSQALIAEASTLQRTPHQVSAECETSSTILAVSFNEFEKEFLRDPDVSLAIIMQLVNKVKQLMNTNMQQTSMQKLANLIFENHELFNKLKNYKIAEILNMAPETFSRNLKKLQANGIISYDNNNFEIKKREELSSLFECCPSYTAEK